MFDKRKIAYIALFVTVTISWGGSFLLVNDIVRDGVPIYFFLAFRFLLAFGILFTMKRVRCEVPTSKQEYGQGILMGIIVFAAFLLQTYGALYTTPSKNGMLTGLYVIMVPLILSVLRKISMLRGGTPKTEQRFAWKPLADAVVCLLGIAVLFDIFHVTDGMNQGDLLTIGAAFAFAVQFVFLERYSVRLNTWNYTSVMLLSVSVLSFIVSLSLEMDFYRSFSLSTTNLWKILFLAAFSTAYAYWVQTYVQSKLSAATVSIVACLESVFAVIFSIAFGYESASTALIVGSLLIFISLLSSVAFTGKNVKKKFPKERQNKVSCTGSLIREDIHISEPQNHVNIKERE